jgi:hypothetical protein
VAYRNHGPGLVVVPGPASHALAPVRLGVAEADREGLSVIPFPFLPFYPEQSWRHYFFHLVWRAAGRRPTASRARAGAADVLWLDYQRLSVKQIARTLKIVSVTVESHWKRMRKKIGDTREEVQTWARERLKGVEATSICYLIAIMA